jgi:hypothetical protein
MKSHVTTSESGHSDSGTLFRRAKTASTSETKTVSDCSKLGALGMSQSALCAVLQADRRARIDKRSSMQEQRNIAINCLSGYVRLVHARLTELTAVVAEPQSNLNRINDS